MRVNGAVHGAGYFTSATHRTTATKPDAQNQERHPPQSGPS